MCTTGTHAHTCVGIGYYGVLHIINNPRHIEHIHLEISCGGVHETGIGTKKFGISYFQFPGYFSVTVFFLKSKNVKTILFLYHHLSSLQSICTQSSISCISFVSSVLSSFILFVFLLKFFLPFLVCFFPTPLKMMDHQPTMCHVRIFAIGP